MTTPVPKSAYHERVLFILRKDDWYRRPRLLWARPLYVWTGHFTHGLLCRLLRSKRDTISNRGMWCHTPPLSREEWRFCLGAWIKRRDSFRALISIRSRHTLGTQFCSPTEGSESSVRVGRVGKNSIRRKSYEGSRLRNFASNLKTSVQSEARIGLTQMIQVTNTSHELQIRYDECWYYLTKTFCVNF